jgi:IS5 family transposase
LHLDRLAYLNFSAAGIEDRVPNAGTIGLFRQNLATAGAIKDLDERFDAMLRRADYIAMSGQLVEAPFRGGPAKARN